MLVNMPFENIQEFAVVGSYINNLEFTFCVQPRQDKVYLHTFDDQLARGCGFATESNARLPVDAQSACIQIRCDLMDWLS
jgi:hypothetical protein